MTHDVPSSWRRARAIAPAWLLGSALLIGGVVLSLALLTHQEPVTEPFTVGTIVLGLTPQSTLISFAGMVPGNEVDGVLTVRNVGTGDLRYAMTVVATNPDAKSLRDVLHLDVERRTGCGGAVMESLYSGAVATAAFGDPQPGANPGDRALAQGTSEDLCFRAILPADTDVLYQGATTNIMLTFLAEQVASNP